MDPFHLNSIFPAKIKKGFVEVGDLLLSLRHMSMLLVYRPSSGKIVWHQSGPWLNQHSAKFDDQGDIYVFDNNLIDTHYNRRREDYHIYGGNKVLRMSVENRKIYDFAPCSIDPTINTVTGGLVTITNQTMMISYKNIFTTVLCDLKTGQKVFLKPDTDSNYKTIPGTGISFIQFSD